MFLYKHWTESPVYITTNLPIYMGIFVFVIETEVSLSFFIKITPHTAVAAITIIAITPSFCPPAQ